MQALRFNIHDLNFLLTFVGFSFITSLGEFIPSIGYRAFALGVAIVCLLSQPLNFKGLPLCLKLFVLLLILLDLKTSFHLLTTQTFYISSRNQALLFIFGVTFIPVLAFISGYNRIHWDICLVVLEFLLVFVVAQGLLSSTYETEIRVSLNRRQSTLAFGDNSGYLLVLSLCLLFRMRRFKSKLWRIISMCFLLGAIVMSFYGFARSGSRGPFLAAIVGALFIIFSLNIRKQIHVFLLGIVLIICSGVTLATLQRFAPVLYSRMEASIEEGDSSGRDILIQNAVDIISDHPFLGGNPIILYPDEFTTYHSGYLEVGVALGVIPFLCYLFLTGWLLFGVFLRRRFLYPAHLLFFAAMLFLSAVRALTGAGLLSNANYTMSIAAACFVATSFAKKTRLNKQ